MKWITGVGKSGHLARLAASLLSSSGVEASYLDPIDAWHGEMGKINSERDSLILISYSGQTPEINRLSNYLPSHLPRDWFCGNGAETPLEFYHRIIDVFWATAKSLDDGRQDEYHPGGAGAHR